MKYKVGDRVRIVSTEGGDDWNWSSEMDKWLGEVMTIRSVGIARYSMKEDDGYWDWHDYMIVGLADEPKNNWEQVAAMFGLKLNEEFEIALSSGNPYKITDKGLVNSKNYGCGLTFLDLLNNKYTIKKLPWKPKVKERYYYVRVCGIVDSTDFWASCDSDIMRRALGNCFRTREEAEANKEKVKKRLGLTEWVK